MLFRSNMQITHGIATHQPVGDLEDQRDRELNTVADAMNVSYFTRPAGDVVVFTGSGQTLVDGGTVEHLDYTPTSSMNETVSYPTNISPISVNGTDITGDIQSGQMSALISMRNTVLPNLAAQFDAVAQGLMTSINAIHNQGASYPASNALTGTTSFATPTKIGRAHV